jgi:hypothetical protein
MSEEHRRYLIVEQGVGAFIVNLVLNGLIAYALVHHLSIVPLWGDPSIARDTLATSFLLPFITALIVTGLARREVRRGRFPSLDWRGTAHPVLGRLPKGRFLRGVLFGLACLALCAPPTLALLGAVGLDGMRFWPFIAFKALYAGVLGALVTPLIALCALGDPLPAPVASHSA